MQEADLTQERRSEILAVAQPFAHDWADELHQVVALGTCGACGADTLYCCRGSWDDLRAEVGHVSFVHLCTSCGAHERAEAEGVICWDCGGDELIRCPLCMKEYLG